MKLWHPDAALHVSHEQHCTGSGLSMETAVDQVGQGNQARTHAWMHPLLPSSRLARQAVLHQAAAVSMCRCPQCSRTPLAQNVQELQSLLTWHAKASPLLACRPPSDRCSWMSAWSHWLLPFRLTMTTSASTRMGTDSSGP